ncbi:hypothetical protein [Enterococcus hirae]|uniref:hypothetical protein n=1 Tax=Enterococcus hirae TaxID=1354 RepID=UPI0019668641|nr:hypothetical protein [Enterococcus hirae]
MRLLAFCIKRIWGACDGRRGHVVIGDVMIVALGDEAVDACRAHVCSLSDDWSGCSGGTGGADRCMLSGFGIVQWLPNAFALVSGFRDGFQAGQVVSQTSWARDG